jgi:hypothetical protein
MQKVRRHYRNYRWFRLLIELLIQTIRYVNTNILFQRFPLQYYTLSLNLLYLALEDGAPIFQRNMFSLYL